MKRKRSRLLILLFSAFSLQLSALTVNIKTVGATFSPDTVYINLGDTIHFIISSNHDAVEITENSYQTNIVNMYPGGFNYTSGT